MNSEVHELAVDFSRRTGAIRALNGVNNGPLNMGGITDLSPFHAELKIPYTRLHDPHWPNPDVVDISAVFPDFNADPENPANYEFGRSDEYIEAIVKLGSRIIYRLGHGIEHTRVKYHTAPPQDYQKWARICIGIIRHYNEGWAAGHHFSIQHWEIWNEPDLVSGVTSAISPTWGGSWKDYFRLYAVAATAIKAYDATLLVGGPAMTGGGVGSGFLAAFLQHCQENELPLDFCSWHHYTSQPAEIVQLAAAVRALLDQHGYTHALSNLNEWNYIPAGMDWGILFNPAYPQQQKKIAHEIAGIHGAAFDAAVLMLLQDCPVDIANYYLADSLPYFSMFDVYGLPLKAFYAFKAFRSLLDTSVRVEAGGADQAAGIHIIAGMNPGQTSAAILVSDRREATGSLKVIIDNLPWQSDGVCGQYVLNEAHDLQRLSVDKINGSHCDVVLDAQNPAVYLLILAPA